MRRSRVLFVCIGNACRSQMAEGFANAYGGDVLTAESAGVCPCDLLSPVTRRLMLEKNIDLGGRTPKAFPEKDDFDLVINMSGRKLPRRIAAEVREWNVPDPIFLSEDDHRAVRDQIEVLVQNLIDELRRRKNSRPQPGAI